MHNRIKLHAFFFGKNNERKGKSMIVQLIENIYQFLWGEWIHVPLPGGGSLGLSLLIILLLPAGIVFTIKTRFLPIRLFPDMVKALTANNKNGKDEKSSLSSLQTLIVSTATRVGMGNLTGVVAAISAGGAGAVFWMWITALLGSSTAFIEATLAQLHKEKDPLYGGYRGGPAYYIHHFMEEKQGKKKKHTLIAALFAISGLICWCGISQVVSNSVAESFHNAFHIPTLYTTIVLVIVAAVIVLRKNATVKVLDIVVPIMAVIYFGITIFVILTNLPSIPGVFARIFKEAFGIRQVAAGGFGAVLMNGVKRGLFSNEAGSGSAPCAAAAADCERPAQMGLVQALGVFIDTIVICTLTGFVVVMGRMWLTEDSAAWFELGKLDRFLTSCGALTGNGTIYHLVTMLVSVCFGLFAFTCLVGFMSFTEMCANRISTRPAFINTIRVLCLVVISFGVITNIAGMDLSALWDLSDFANILMVYCNLPLQYIGFKYVLRAWEHFEKNDGTAFTSKVAGIDVPVWDEHAEKRK